MIRRSKRKRKRKRKRRVRKRRHTDGDTDTRRYTGHFSSADRGKHNQTDRC